MSRIIAFLRSLSVRGIVVHCAHRVMGRPDPTPRGGRPSANETEVKFDPGPKLASHFNVLGSEPGWPGLSGKYPPKMPLVPFHVEHYRAA